MRRPAPHLPLAHTVSEAELQAAIMALAALLGWRRAHFRPAQVGGYCKHCRGKTGLDRARWATPMEGETGWPDLVLARHGTVVMAELKRSGKYPTPEQLAWLDVLRTVPGVVTRVWRPEDWISGEVERVLRGAA